MNTQAEFLDVTEIRKLVIHVQCRTTGSRLARDEFKAKLSQLISRAPRIKWWA